MTRGEQRAELGSEIGAAKLVRRAERFCAAECQPCGWEGPDRFFLTQAEHDAMTHTCGEYRTDGPIAAARSGHSPMRDIMPAGDRVHIGLVGCGKTKAQAAQLARYLYTGPLFKAASAYAERTYDFWFILSAQHYLVHPTEILDPYTRSVAGLSAEQKRHWGEMVESDLRLGHSKSTQGRHDPVHLTTPRLLLGRWLEEHHQKKQPCELHLYFHAGRDYVDPVATAIRKLDDHRTGRSWTVHTPMAGLEIGQQLHWYAEHRKNTA